MNRILGVVVVAMLAGCGTPEMGDEWCDDGGLASAPIVDAGSIPDAGTSDPCSEPTTLKACGAALVTLTKCCAGFDDYVAPTEAAFCEHVAGGDADPAVACKDMGSLPCTEVASEGLCY